MASDSLCELLFLGVACPSRGKALSIRSSSWCCTFKCSARSIFGGGRCAENLSD